MYCPKCGVENEDNYNYCKNCSYPREGKKTKRNKKIPVGIFCGLVAVIAGIWVLGDSEEGKGQKEEQIKKIEASEVDQGKEQEQEQELAIDSDSETLLQNFIELVKESKNAMVVLNRNPEASKYIIEEEDNVDEATKLFQEKMFEDYKQAFDQMVVIKDYSFIYNPEYLVYFDNNACYTVMADEIDGERVAILQIDGDETLYRGKYDLYYNAIRTTLEDDFGYMHIFYTAKDTASAMDGAARNSLVEMYVKKYYSEMAYSFNEGETFRIEDIVINRMSEVNPDLYSALIQYSVKPVITDEVALPDNMNIYLEDGWIKGGFVVAALWNEEKVNRTRSYMLGLTAYEYDVNGESPEEVAKLLYEQSNVKNFIE